MGGVVSSIVGKPKVKPKPKPEPALEPAPKETETPSLDVRDENTARAVTARSNRSGLVSSRRGSQSTRGGLRVPR